MLTHDRLCEVLRYNVDEGRFYWINGGRGIKPSKSRQAGSFDAHGYGQVSIGKKIYKEHRLVWFYVHGEWPTGQIDHINHQRRDNRIENLRIVDNTENHKNRPMQKNNKTGCPGVSYDRGSFVAKITVHGTQIHLGRFRVLEDAINARGKANNDYEFHVNHGVGVGKQRSPRLPDGIKKNNSVYIEHDGRRMIAAEWANEQNCTVTGGIIADRIRRGWNISDAIYLPRITGKQRSDKRIRLANGTYAPKIEADAKKQLKEMRNE